VTAVEAAATALEHQQAQALFAPMVDHELAPQEEAALKSHLSSCRDCQAGFEKYSRAVALVRAVGRERVPDDFTAQVLKRVRKRRRAYFGLQGARIFEHIGIPSEGAIIVIIAAALVALMLHFLAH
jgi:anti-sigma factor RsiW